MVKSKFKATHNFEDRKTEADKILNKYENRVPVILESHDNNIKLDKCKFLVPGDITVGKFVYIIRKRVKLNPNEAIYLFTPPGMLPSTMELMSKLYHEHKDPDNFLYLTINTEATFGMA